MALNESDALKLYLGSIAPALRVDEIDDSDLELVITMNKDDQLQRVLGLLARLVCGPWADESALYSGYDEPRGWENDWGHYLEKFLTTWSTLVHDFGVWHAARVSSAGRVAALGNCLGGVNCSSAAALCLMMALEGFTLAEALQASVFTHKLRLCPRQTFCWLFCCLNMYTKELPLGGVMGLEDELRSAGQSTFQCSR